MFIRQVFPTVIHCLFIYFLLLLSARVQCHFLLLFFREEGKISRKLVECINTYLLNDGPNLGFQLFEIHNAMQQFVFCSWLTTHDRVLKVSYNCILKQIAD